MDKENTKDEAEQWAREFLEENKEAIAEILNEQFKDTILGHDRLQDNTPFGN